jgi:hypothetical protein
VEDFDAIAPFDGVTARPALLLLQRGPAMRMPVPYRIWRAANENGARLRAFKSAAEFRRLATCTTMQARPVPGGHGERPWIVGTEDDHDVFAKVFTSGAGRYVARKGVTTDRNGIYWVQVEAPARDGLVHIRNSPDVGRTRGIAARRALVEAEHVFPLLRGRGVQPFCAQPDGVLRILLPQRGMHGNPNLAEDAPHALRYLKSFKAELEARSSFRRFQARAGHPYYSLWSTGAYTFEPFKVLWREMGGGTFAAAYVGHVDDPLLGSRLVIPDHKLYFIPVATEAEAAYLTGLLNAPLIARAVGAYASQLSLGASVAEYVHLPPFASSDPVHATIAKLARKITHRGGGASDDELGRLDSLAHAALGATTQGESK